MVVLRMKLIDYKVVPITTRFDASFTRIKQKINVKTKMQKVNQLARPASLNQEKEAEVEVVVEGRKPRICFKILLMIRSKLTKNKSQSTLRWEWNIVFLRKRRSEVVIQDLLPVNVREIKNCSGRAIGARSRLKRKKKNKRHTCIKLELTTGRIEVGVIGQPGHLPMDIV